MKALQNPFPAKGNWYKANLHTHTTASDGRASPAETADLYRRAGYHVLAITDHSVVTDVRGLSDEGFLVMRGLEYHPRCRQAEAPHHLVGLGVPHGFGFDGVDADDASACIKAVRAAGGESVLAHPLWCGHRYDMYAHLGDYIAVEVFNTTCDRVARSNVLTYATNVLSRHRGSHNLDLILVFLHNVLDHDHRITTLRNGIASVNENRLIRNLQPHRPHFRSTLHARSHNRNTVHSRQIKRRRRQFRRHPFRTDPAPSFTDRHTLRSNRR